MWKKLVYVRALSSPVTESEASSSLHSELTNAELAPVKRCIPKIPKLLFKKVELETIAYQETNDSGTVEVAVSVSLTLEGGYLTGRITHGWRFLLSVSSVFAELRRK
ncbi:hypothetical protein P3T76_013340 [Phytophthora citrophthora]|uniref:Uncharacterized protein n=1 Tax=Phytophthora citrophthora TaxID=4793 RepID=A0AAD9G3N8_9STRA|nr:hypothetical protein P3T76_013340 [Phytophthora citrophthora]